MVEEWDFHEDRYISKQIKYINPKGEIACNLGEFLVMRQFDEVTRLPDLTRELIDENRAFPFHEGLARVMLNGKYGFINKKGERIIKPQYEEANDFRQGRALVKVKVPHNQFLWGYVDRKGQFVIPPQFEQAEDFSEGLAAVKVEGSWGYIDRKGNIVIQPLFDAVKAFSENLAPVEVAGSWGFLGKTKSTVETTERWFLWLKKRKTVFAEKYDMVIEPQFHDAWPFSHGLAQVMVDGEYFFIDRMGNRIHIQQDSIVRMLHNNPPEKLNFQTDEIMIRRNRPCPCGSGRKYKHCHGRY